MYARTLLFRAVEGPPVKGVKDAVFEVEKCSGIDDALLFTIDDDEMLMVFLNKADCLKLAEVLQAHANTNPED